MIKIISYQPEFKDQIISIVKKVLDEEFGYPVNKKTEPHIYNIPFYFQRIGGNFWIAVDNQKVIGTMGLTKYSRARGYLLAMYVLKKYRKKGIASNLFKKLFDFAQKNGYKSIYLATAEEMTPARNFYEKVGFKQVISLPEDFPKIEEALFFKLKI